MVLVSSPNVSPMRQVAWALNEQLLRLHAPDGVRDLLTRAMGGVGFNFLRYDGTPALRGMTQPVLALYGTADPSIPFVESTRTLTTRAERGRQHRLHDPLPGRRRPRDADPRRAVRARRTCPRSPTGSWACRTPRAPDGADRRGDAGAAVRGGRRARPPPGTAGARVLWLTLMPGRGGVRRRAR